jgi:hypothetical protein
MLVIDNLRTAVSRADWFDPERCPEARAEVEHYGIAVLPTKKPRTVTAESPNVNPAVVAAPRPGGAAQK